MPFLNKAYYKEWGAKEEKSDMPPYLQAIVKLQDKTGKWFPSKDLYSSLGGAIPDPPEGISPWRWCCALVMAFMRRHPEHIDELRESYKKGLEWTEPRIIEYAREGERRLERSDSGISPTTIIKVGAKSQQMQYDI